METLKGKAPSWRARCWTRLLDPDKPPRRWWYPPSSRRDDVLRMSEEARQAHQKVVEQAHEKFSETIRLAMLSLLGFTLFCLLITLSTPDSALLVADPTIKMPFADVQVSFQSFLILAPFLLIVVALYLHIFYGYWLDLEIDYQHLMLRREAREPSIERLPTLFSLDHPVPRLLTAFIFYWLVLIVLLVITWKAAARVEWGVPLALLTCLVTGTLVFLRIRRRPAAQRWWNRPRWAVLGLIVGCMAAIMVEFVAQLLQPRLKPALSVSGFVGDFTWATITRAIPRPELRLGMAMAAQRKITREMVFFPQWLPRPLNIFRADLKGKWLTAVNLRDADASLVNLEGAKLYSADLGHAKLWAANLQEADLESADLGGADLRRANLRGANLWGANLRGTDFQKVEDLTEKQIQWAETDENTKLPPHLKTPGSAEHNDTAPPRESTMPME
jgi:hypothetical protein